MKFINNWRMALQPYFEAGVEPKSHLPKTLIVNQQDLEEYEEYLSSKYEGGIIPIVGGVLRYKNIPLGISDQLARGEWAIEEEKK